MRSAGVYLVLYALAVESALVFHLIVAAELLKLAVSASYAGKALAVVGGKYQLKRLTPCRCYFGGISVYLHAVGNGVDAGGDHSLGTERRTSHLGDLCNAHTAGTDLVYLLEVAEGGNLNACQP